MRKIRSGEHSVIDLLTQSPNMKTVEILCATLVLLILWSTQGETKAVNDWNDNYPDDFFDPYDQIPPQKHHAVKPSNHKHKKDREDVNHGNHDVIRDPGYQGEGHHGNKEGKGPFYRATYPENVRPFTGRDDSWDNRVGPQYQGDWEKLEWDEKIMEGLKQGEQLLNNDWERGTEDSSSEEGSGSNGFDSDDEDSDEDVDGFTFEEEQLEHDENRVDRLELQLEETERERDKLLRRFNRVQNRVEEERQVLTQYNRY